MAATICQLRPGGGPHPRAGAAPRLLAQASRVGAVPSLGLRSVRPPFEPRRLQGKCRGRVMPPRATEDMTTEEALVEATYSGPDALWLTQEKERVVDVAPGAWDNLVLTRGTWSWNVRQARQYSLTGTMTFHNTSKKAEIFVPEVAAKVKLLCPRGLDDIVTSVTITPRHPENELKDRSDGYWPAYIIKAGGSTQMEITIDITANQGDLSGLEAAWLTVDYFTYGPHGRTPMAQDAILPLSFPAYGEKPEWRAGELGDTLAIPTHLLCHLDDPVGAVQAYVSQHARDGDILTIGESPLALMQGRFRHPRGIKPTWVAKFANRWFHPTSSLATACGMQALIDTTRRGAVRIFLSVILAAICRIVGLRGMFYRLAGEQAALVDDVTGTLPPYDQFICLGPVRVDQTCEAVLERTGLKCAVVDVNDLSIKTGAVRVLGKSSGFSEKDLEVMTEALKPNPAGNADEQTPLVLIRPHTPLVL